MRRIDAQNFFTSPGTNEAAHPTTVEGDKIASGAFDNAVNALGCPLAMPNPFIIRVQIAISAYDRHDELRKITRRWSYTLVWRTNVRAKRFVQLQIIVRFHKLRILLSGYRCDDQQTQRRGCDKGRNPRNHRHHLRHPCRYSTS